MNLRIYIPGLPAPQGSKRAIPNRSTGRVSLVESSARVKPWREDVRAAALDAYSGPALTGPLYVEITFWIPRPRGHYGTGRNADTLRPSAPEYPAGKPDVDKLARAILDALTSAGTWRDDSQVVSLSAAKVYATRDHRPGCRIDIEEV